VDDGSTDCSRDIIQGYGETNKNIVTIFKDNEGQLSCFNAACQFIPENAQVFLLDADDVYPKNYVETLQKKVTFPIDFAFVKAIKFEGSATLQDARLISLKNITYKKTAELVRIGDIWIGDVTSTLSISGSAYKKIFPYPYCDDWKTRADDVFIFALSFLGFKKTSVPSVGVSYRIHGNNDHVVRKDFYDSDQEILERGRRLNRLYSYYAERYSLRREASYLMLLVETVSTAYASKFYANRILRLYFWIIRTYIWRRLKLALNFLGDHMGT
jgi:glycosyltransferase involved in cell wall biosynthesis